MAGLCTYAKDFCYRLQHVHLCSQLRCIMEDRDLEIFLFG